MMTIIEVTPSNSAACTADTLFKMQ